VGVILPIVPAAPDGELEETVVGVASVPQPVREIARIATSNGAEANFVILFDNISFLQVCDSSKLL
jgi:hypothetical protein